MKKILQIEEAVKVRRAKVAEIYELPLDPMGVVEEVYHFLPFFWTY